MPNDKLTFSELEEKLINIDISDKELQKYFISNKEHARPFEPALKIDPNRVEVEEADEIRVEAGIVSGFINRVSRLRRRRRFRANRDKFPERKTLVSEGDSWFQFPFFLEDVIDHLSSDFNIYSTGAAGDTLRNMILRDPEYIDALDDLDGAADGFVFSGGGNDIIGEDGDGEPVIKKLVKDFDPGLSPEQHLIEDAVNDRFSFIRKCYEILIKDIHSEFPNLPIFLHSYGFVFPGNFSDDDTRDPFYADEDEWIAGPLSGKGITDPMFQRDIIKILLNRLRTLQGQLAGNDVHPIDVLESLPSVNQWNDEIHPNDAGFAIVADKFKSVIQSEI